MFDLFKTFITVYETKSFTHAAQNLFISQPTVTVRIQKLEKELKATLFLRDQNHQIIPTEAATLFYPQAIAQLKDWQQFKANMHQRSANKMPFKIAVSHSAATSIMPIIFKVLEPYLDNLDLTIEMQNSEEVFKLVCNHNIQFGIIEKPIRGDQTQSFALFQDELVLAGPQNTGNFFIREEGSGVSHYTKQYLKSSSLQIDHLISMNSNDMIVAHIKAGLGASLISKRFVDQDTIFQELNAQYQRVFYGLAYLDERDPLVLKIIDDIRKIKNI